MGQGLGRQQWRFPVERIDKIGRFRPCPATGLIDRAKTIGDQQTGFDTLAFKNSVGGNSGPMDQRRDVRRRNAHPEELVERGHNGV